MNNNKPNKNQNNQNNQNNQKKKAILIGFLLGFIFFTLMDKGAKMKPLIGNTIIIKFANHNYHIHHWIIFLLLLLILLFIIGLNISEYNSVNALILGICLGSVLQGLTYNDAFDIRLK